MSKLLTQGHFNKSGKMYSSGVRVSLMRSLLFDVSH